MVGEPDRVRAGRVRPAARTRRSSRTAAATRPRPSSRTAGARGRCALLGQASSGRTRHPYAGAVLECVVNVSEGRDMDKLRRLGRRRAGRRSIDVHADADHHRSVFTLAGPGTTRRGRRRPARSPSAVAEYVHDRRPRGRAPAVRRARRRAVRRARRHQRRTRAGRRRGPHASASGGPRRSPSRCSSTTTPNPTKRDLPARAHARLPQPQARLRARRTAPDPRRDGGRRAPPAGRGQLRAREPRHQRRPPDRARRCANSDGGLPGRARARLLPARSATRAGVDEPRRPRPHRRAGRVPARARARAEGSAPTSRRSSWSA